MVRAMMSQRGIQELMSKICEAVGLEPDEINRIVIDLDANEPGPIRVHFTKILMADEYDKLLEVDFPPAGFRIVEGAKLEAIDDEDRVGWAGCPDGIPPEKELTETGIIP